MILQRLATTLTAIWVGIMIGVGYVFAPILFKMMSNERPFAGQIAGEAFTAVAYISLVFGVILMLIIRRENARSNATQPSTALYLILMAVGLAIINHFIITPEMVVAKSGMNAQWSFSTLHMMSQIVYVAQIILLLALNWVMYKPIMQNDNKNNNTTLTSKTQEVNPNITSPQQQEAQEKE
ncbi:MAG: DUF4149 domain-containing protein [Saezia sp.]